MRIGDKVWHSSRIEVPNATIPTYSKPSEIVTRTNYMTVMPASSKPMAVFQYGEDISDKWVVIASQRAFNGKIKVGDVFWVDGANPITKLETEYGFGATANAEVVSVDYVNATMTIILKANKRQVKK